MWTEIHDPEHEYSPYTWVFAKGDRYKALYVFEDQFGERPDWGWCDDCRDDHSFSGVWVSEHDTSLPDLMAQHLEVERETVQSCNYVWFEDLGRSLWRTPHKYTRIRRQTLSEWIDEHHGEFFIL